MKYAFRNGVEYRDGVRIYSERLASVDPGCRCRWSVERVGKAGAPRLTRYCPTDVYCSQHSASLQESLARRAMTVMAIALDAVCGDPMRIGATGRAARFTESARRLLASAERQEGTVTS